MQIRNIRTKQEYETTEQRWNLIQKRGLAYKYEILAEVPPPAMKEVKPVFRAKSPKIEIQNLLATLKPDNE